MQKLQAKLKNTPRNASLVPCSVNSRLTREETLSVVGIVRTCNNPEVNHQQHRADQNLRVSDIVYVLNLRGEPLMPCRQQKSRKLLKEGRAKVVKRAPFTIQLCAPTGETKQSVVLGIDTGFGNIGFSAVSEKEELISGTVKRLKQLSTVWLWKGYKEDLKKEFWKERTFWSDGYFVCSVGKA